MHNGGTATGGSIVVSLPHLQRGDSAADVVAALDSHGAVIVEGLLDADLLARFNAELDPLLAAAQPDRKFLNPAIEWFFGKRTRHVAAVAAHSRTFATDVLCHPLLLAICDAVLGPACARYQLNIAHVLDRGPGAEAQLLHRDEAVWVHVPRPHPELQVASVIALEDFCGENGATRVVPGSHRWPADRKPKPGEIADAVMPTGAAVIYLGSTIHGAGANTTADRRRRGMHVSYVVGWLRTEENQYLSVPVEVVRTLPRRAQELLGWAAHDALAAGGGYLGTVDLRDPVDLLAEGRL
ncbi:MAG: mitomycin antibiotic biosynthesis protein [Deltaproteobacteria bacterium]|nr:MAG: mitomycin antibiotic biosynthesis protein [Deltaproteobacteria bacterium]